jgi:hypothetical protein
MHDRTPFVNGDIVRDSSVTDDLQLMATTVHLLDGWGTKWAGESRSYNQPLSRE